MAFGRSSGLHPVSSHSCCMNVRAGRPAFDWPYAGVHRSTSLTISSLLFQQCPACLIRLACIVFVIGGRWPYSWRSVGCCCQDLFQYCSQHSCIIAVELQKRNWVVNWSVSVFCLHYFTNSVDVVEFTTLTFRNVKITRLIIFMVFCLCVSLCCSSFRDFFFWHTVIPSLNRSI